MNTTQTFYEWSVTSFSVPAQVVGETVERLALVNGGVCPPGALVEEARPDDHELHHLFQWNDADAGDAWRRQQARQVINAVRVVPAHDDTSNPVPSYPAFVSVVILEDDGVRRGYKPLSMVVDRPDEYAQVLGEARAAFGALRRRYASIKEFSPVFEVLDRLEL